MASILEAIAEVLAPLAQNVVQLAVWRLTHGAPDPFPARLAAALREAEADGVRDPLEIAAYLEPALRNEKVERFIVVAIRKRRFRHKTIRGDELRVPIDIEALDDWCDRIGGGTFYAFHQHVRVAMAAALVTSAGADSALPSNPDRACTRALFELGFRDHCVILPAAPGALTFSAYSFALRGLYRVGTLDAPRPALVAARACRRSRR